MTSLRSVVLLAHVLFASASAESADFFEPVDAYPPPLTTCGGWGPEPCAFSDNAVLSSSTPWSGGVTPALVFGAANPGEKITLSGLPSGAIILPSNPFVADATGLWEITIASPDSMAGNTLVFSGDANKNVTLSNIRFGLTILCSGQSNMDFNIDSAFYANETVVASSSFSADIFYKHNPEGAWTVTGSNDDSLLDFSAVCYFTAMHMKLSLPAMKDVPIGIVQGSKGGTTIESWMNAPALVAAGLPAANATCGFTGGCAAQAYCGNLNRFIAPLAPFTFKLLAWYQGEANEPCNALNGPFTTPGYYARLLPAFLTAWRALFRSPLSAYIVMLAPVGATQETSADRDNVSSLVSLRDAQLTAIQNVNEAHLIYPVDMGDDGKTVYTPPSFRHGGLHPRNKTEFGRRIALAFGEREGVLPPGVLGSGPVFVGATVEPAGTSLLLTFELTTAPTTLLLSPTTDCYTFGRGPPPPNDSPAYCCQNNADPSSPHGFPFEVEVAGEWQLAAATVVPTPAGAQAALVRLTTLAAASGTLSGRVRYAWDNYPLCVLANDQALPLPPFVMA